jgi:hypothetical protein
MKLTISVLVLLLLAACSRSPHNEGVTAQSDKHSKATFTEVPDKLDEMNDCTANSDCIIVDGGCGNPMAISSKYREAAQPHLLMIYAAVDCAAPSEQVNPSVAVCVENVCQVAL